MNRDLVILKDSINLNNFVSKSDLFHWIDYFFHLFLSFELKFWFKSMNPEVISMS